MKLEVPLQEKYEGTAPVIPSSLAKIPCSELGIYGLLQKLNEVLGTHYTLDAPHQGDSVWNPVVNPEEGDSDWSDVEEDKSDDGLDDTVYADPLQELLFGCIHAQLDFGMAYAQLRPWWYLDHALAQREIVKRRADDEFTRQDALYQWSHRSAPTIDDPDTYPRRVWDLYANRIVPMWAVTETSGIAHPKRQEKPNIVGVSHSWMSEELRHPVETHINSFEWPVPIPVDTTLERVRIELLNLGLEYAWLDVLCLRQVGRDSTGEALRRHEWGLDVPTIGFIYQGRKVVHYYSGLGRPFRIGDLHSDRHWLNRAWTLQEIGGSSIVAGVTADSPVNLPKDDQTGLHIDENLCQFYDRLAKLAELSEDIQNIFPVLAAMRHRASVNVNDKICGLAYLLRSQRLPAYDADEPMEEFWSRFIDTIKPRFRGDLLFLYPEPGNGTYTWAPSCQQVRDVEALPDSNGISLCEGVYRSSNYSIYCYCGYRLDGCFLDGLAQGGSRSRMGRMVLTDGTGLHHVFPVLALHNQPIPHGDYTLIGSQNCQYWVVGHVKEEERLEFGNIRRPSRLEKVSVLCLDGGEKIVQKLQALGLARVTETGFF